jgi:hypothetical protein
MSAIPDFSRMEIEGDGRQKIRCVAVGGDGNAAAFSETSPEGM